MKRDENLMDLSRDHHHALVLARRAAQTAGGGGDDDVGLLWAEVAAAFEAELGPHFDVEERHLLPPLEAAGQGVLVRRTLEEHARLRELLGAGGDARARLQAFGELLRDHVRFEESELFPAAERVLGPSALAAVAEASAATEAARERAADRARKGS